MRMPWSRKQCLAVGAALALGFAAAAAWAADPKPAAAQGALPALLGELWAKLRAISPRSANAQATAVPTMTAGIRGVEATETELKPYWKGDREQDPAFRAERQALQAAQDLADAGKYAEAAQAFDAFLKTYPRGTMAGHARFGGALAHAAQGDRARARAALEDFLKQDAQHPLARDAEQALSALK